MKAIAHLALNFIFNYFLNVFVIETACLKMLGIVCTPDVYTCVISDFLNELQSILPYKEITKRFSKILSGLSGRKT